MIYTANSVTEIETLLLALPIPTQRTLIKVQIAGDEARKLIKGWLESRCVRYYPLNDGVIAVDLNTLKR